LNPLKIQGRFNFEFVLEFITLNSGEFEVRTKRKVVHYASHYLYPNVGKFWTKERSPKGITKFVLVLKFWKKNQ
jgi:hypothetical protein